MFVYVWFGLIFEDFGVDWLVFVRFMNYDRIFVLVELKKDLEEKGMDVWVFDV